MSGVILISDSDEEENENPPIKLTENENMDNGNAGDSCKKEDIQKPKFTTEELFFEFSEMCAEHLKDNVHGERIIKYLHTKHRSASPSYKTSRQYRKLLQSYVHKLREGSKDVAVYINDVTTIIDTHKTKDRDRISPKMEKESSIKRGMEDESVPKDCSKKRRIDLESVQDTQKASIPTFIRSPLKTNGQTNSNDVIDEDERPSTSGKLLNKSQACHSRTSNENARMEKEKRHRRKVEYLEKLLKKLSDEITALQEKEITLDEMDEEDSAYIQESMLKAKSLKVYKELCLLNKASLRTGRVSERTVKVKASRFHEINRKVEIFVNNSNAKFPDFYDILLLVKRANNKSNLQLSDKQVKTTAKNIFLEVGEKLQKRRQEDLVYEFGNSALDKSKDAPDPAIEDKDLRDKLKKNRKLAKIHLDEVIEKYSNLQYEVDEKGTAQNGVNEDSDGSNSSRETNLDENELEDKDREECENLQNEEADIEIL